MYYSITEAVGTGSAVAVAVPPHLDKSHITVYVDGLPTEAFEWINAQTISVIAPLNRTIRVVRRTSPDARLTAYLNGTSLPGETLEVDSKQAFFLAQEAHDVAVDAVSALQGAPTVGGVELTTAGIVALLNGQITPSLLETALRAKVDLIDADAATIGSPAWLVAQEEAAREGAIAAEYAARVAALQAEAASRAAAIANETTLRIDADGVLASQINTVAASAASNQAAIQSEQTTRASEDAALASDINTVVSFIDTDVSPRLATVETSASTSATRLGTVESNYTMKVQARADGKFAFAGIGLAATAGGSTPTQSEMVFLADKFTFVPSQADMNAVPQPLLVMGLVNGVNTLVVPPSRWGDNLIEARMIVDGGIQARHMKITGGQGSSLWIDPNVLDLSAWRVSSWGVLPTQVSVSDGISGTKAWQSPTGAPASASGVRGIPVVPGKRYRVSCYARSGGGANGKMYLRLAGGATETAMTGGGYYPGHPDIASYTGSVEAIVPPTTWTRYSWEFSPGANLKFVSPATLLNWTGTAGWMQSQDLRIEEMLDHTLIVQGGIKADRIDTRGLTIKDEAGNVLFGSGINLDWSLINASADWSNAAITPKLLSRPNLVPNGGFANGLSGWTGATSTFSASDNVWGRVLMSGTASGTNAIWSPKFPVAVGEWYTITGDSVLFASGGSCYFDMIFYDASGAVLLDGPQSAVAATHDFSSTDENRTTHAVEVQAPAGSVTAAARFVWSAVTSPTAVGCRQIKVERGRLPFTAFSDEATAVSTAGTATAAVGPANPVTPANVSTFIQSAAIGSAQVGVLTAANLTVTALSNTVNGGASSGGRVTLETNKVSVFDANGVRRTVMGYLL
jgi:hypothetical protein